MDFQIYICEGCRRTFAERSALTSHENTCQPSKKCIAKTLNNARELLSDHKRQRLEALASFLPNNPTNEGVSGMAETEAVSTNCVLSSSLANIYAHTTRLRIPVSESIRLSFHPTGRTLKPMRPLHSL